MRTAIVAVDCCQDFRRPLFARISAYGVAYDHSAPAELAERLRNGSRIIRLNRGQVYARPSNVFIPARSGNHNDPRNSATQLDGYFAEYDRKSLSLLELCTRIAPSNDGN